jgi:preprotein translocase subunit SecA
VARINQLEEIWKKKSDAELRDMTVQFWERLDKRRASREPAARSLCHGARGQSAREQHAPLRCAAHRRHGPKSRRDCRDEDRRRQDAGGRPAPLYFNALQRKGAHLITVNDYLALRDAEWMGRVYKFLGMTVGTIVHGQADNEKQLAYRCDITYGTNNEFGFDYLRDNMKESIERYVQRPLHYAIVDEVDSILIDEARTPLIISGPAEQSAHLYFKVNQIIPRLKKDVDYTVDEKHHSAVLTDAGVERVEKLLQIHNLYDPAEHLVQPPRAAGAARAHAVQARRQLHGHRRRQGGDHRRVYRASDAGVGAGRTDCTKRSKPKKTSRSKKRRRRWRRSRFRTCSVCTTSWRV